MWLAALTIGLFLLGGALLGYVLLLRERERGQIATDDKRRDREDRHPTKK